MPGKGNSEEALGYWRFLTPFDPFETAIPMKPAGSLYFFLPPKVGSMQEGMS